MVSGATVFLRAVPFWGRLKPVAEFLELGLNNYSKSRLLAPSDSEKFLRRRFPGDFPQKAQTALTKTITHEINFFHAPAIKET